MNVLMVGVSKERSGGMWTVAENFINNQNFVEQTNLRYVGTATSGSMLKRIAHMVKGYLEIVKILTNEKIDIVHVHMAEKGSIFRKGFVILMAKHKGCKTVIQMHAGPIMDWYSRQNALVKYWVKKIFNSSDVFLVLGEFWKEQLTEIIPNNKIKVLYNGIICPKTNDYNVSGKYITFTGLLKRTKGCFDLVDAIKMIDDKLDPEIKVILCGTDIDGLEKYVNENGLKNRFKFTGWVDKLTIKKIMNNTMVTVLPSYFEALSMSVLESISNGIPVVTTNISTMREVLGDDIFLCQPGDVYALSNYLREIIDDKNLRIKQSNELYARAKNIFHLTVITNNLLDIYEEVLNG